MNVSRLTRLSFPPSFYVPVFFAFLSPCPFHGFSALFMTILLIRGGPFLTIQRTLGYYECPRRTLFPSCAAPHNFFACLHILLSPTSDAWLQLLPLEEDRFLFSCHFFPRRRGWRRPLALFPTLSLLIAFAFSLKRLAFAATMDRVSTRQYVPFNLSFLIRYLVFQSAGLLSLLSFRLL